VQRLAELTKDWIRATRDQPGQAAQRRKMDHVVATWESGVDYICRRAPHLILAYTPEGRCTDGIIALTYLELAAYARGLGPCWAGWVNGAANNWPPMKEHLGLPPGHRSCGGMMIGYPEYGYHRIPSRDEAHIVWR
jgi:nitroreductase